MWPDDTQPNGYRMFNSQMTHHTHKWLSNAQGTDTQPNGYRMFEGQTHR